MAIINLFGHITLGTAIGVLVCKSPIELSLVLFGSLLPDIDHPHSTLGKFNPLAKAMKHRGKCHSVIGALLLSIPFYSLNIKLGFLVFIGALSHLLGDKLLSLFPKHKKFNLKLW